MFSWFQYWDDAHQLLAFLTSGLKGSSCKIIFRFIEWCNIDVICEIDILFSILCRWYNLMITGNITIAQSIIKSIVQSTGKCIGIKWTNYNFIPFMLMVIVIYHYMVRIPFLKDKLTVSIILLITLGFKKESNVTCISLPLFNVTNWFRAHSVSSQ